VRRMTVLFFVLMLVMALAVPCCFAGTVPAAAGGEAQVQQPQGVDQPVSGGGTAGIRPVGPDEFAGKISGVIDRAYAVALPLADSLAKVMLFAAGVVALLFLFSGVAVLKRVAGAVIAVGVGLLLLYGAPHIIGLVKGLAM